MGERIKAIREIQNLKPKEMAEKLGIEAPAYRMYERGERKMPIEVAGRFASMTFSTVEYIYYGTNHEEFARKLYEKYKKAPDHARQTIGVLLNLDD